MGSATARQSLYFAYHKLVRRDNLSRVYRCVLADDIARDGHTSSAASARCAQPRQVIRSALCGCDEGSRSGSGLR